jgi:aspartyl protease family protein
VTDLPGWLKPTTVWLVLAAAVFLGVQAWQKQQQTSQFVVNGSTVEIQRAGDGHYHWPGAIGRPRGDSGGGGSEAQVQTQVQIDFLVDTGATSTAIPLALARQLGLQEVGQVQSHTAGGVVTGRVVLADVSLNGGVQVQRMRLTALPDLQAPLLGMDVLGKLRLSQQQGVLRVEPAQASAEPR